MSLRLFFTSSLWKVCIPTILIFCCLSIQYAEGSSKKLDEIMSRGVLRVAMFNQDTPPFYYEYSTERQHPTRSIDKDFHYIPDNSILTENSAVVAGLDAEIIKGFALKLGVKVEFIRQAQSLNDVVEMVASGQADVGICKLSITFDRTKKVLFTKPYIKLRKALIINRSLLELQRGDRTKEQAIRQLHGTLGVIGNSSYENYAYQRFLDQKNRLRPLLIKGFTTWQGVVEAVANKEIVAGFRDEAEVKYVIKRNKRYAKDILTVVLQEDFDPKGIAVQPDAFFLKFMLETYLDSLGLELTANNVILNFPEVIRDITRYHQYYTNNAQGEAE